MSPVVPAPESAEGHVECPACNGSGEVDDHRNEWGSWETKPCYRCDRTGEVWKQ